jgi:hypothetical protein
LKYYFVLFDQGNKPDEKCRETKVQGQQEKLNMDAEVRSFWWKPNDDRQHYLSLKLGIIYANPNAEALDSRGLKTSMQLCNPRVHGCLLRTRIICVLKS